MVVEVRRCELSRRNQPSTARKWIAVCPVHPKYNQREFHLSEVKKFSLLLWRKTNWSGPTWTKIVSHCPDENINPISKAMSKLQANMFPPSFSVTSVPFAEGTMYAEIVIPSAENPELLTIKGSLLTPRTGQNIIHNCFICCISIHGRCHALPRLNEFSGVVQSCFTLSRQTSWTEVLLSWTGRIHSDHCPRQLFIQGQGSEIVSIALHASPAVCREFCRSDLTRLPGFMQGHLFAILLKQNGDE